MGTSPFIQNIPKIRPPVGYPRHQKIEFPFPSCTLPCSLPDHGIHIGKKITNRLETNFTPTFRCTFPSLLLRELPLF